MKIIIATGNSEIDKRIKLSNHVLVDSVSDLNELIDLLNYVEVDALVVNRLLASGEEKLIELAKMAQDKEIKIVILTDRVDDYQERKLISTLANLSVYSFITFGDLNEKSLNDALNNYPTKFDFGILAETIIKEIPVEKENIVERIVNFHNKVFTVVGNPELTAELSVIAAKHCDKKVAIIDLNFFNSGLDMLLRLVTRSNFFEYIENGKVSSELFERCCIQVNGLNIYILIAEYRHQNYHTFRNSPIDKLIDFAYRNFDLTVLNVDASVLDEYAVMAIQNSDHTILSLKGDRISRGQAENYAIYMNNTYNIPLDRFNYVIFDYDETIDAPLGYFKSNIPEDKFLGYISFNKKRHTHRNSKVIFARKIQGKYLNEYISLLLKFNIVNKRVTKDKVLNIKSSIIKLFKLKIRKLRRR